MSRLGGRQGLFGYRFNEMTGPSAQEEIRHLREAVETEGVSLIQIVEAMRLLGICAGREEELAEDFLRGEDCALGVALAVNWLLRGKPESHRH